MTRSFTLALRQAQSKSNSSQGFTLIELLIVIAIVAILSVVVILALNPGELLKQARDSSRLSDLNSLHKALSLYQVDNPAGSFGTASTTYISYPDSSASCANIGISTSTIANGYSYACAPSSTYTKIDGTGWVPVNLSSITGGAPISQLPRDPVNTTSSNNYYTYIGNSSNWALTSLLESQKYLSQSGQKDGGYDPGRFEKGSDLTLISQGEGLTGWWQFDDSSASDASGRGNNGTWAGTAAYAVGKVGSLSASLDGASYIDIDNFYSSSTISLSGWIKSSAYGGKIPFSINSDGYASGPNVYMAANVISWNTGDSENNAFANSSYPDSVWHHLAVVNDALSNAKLYIDGNLVGTAGFRGATTTGSTFRIGNFHQGGYALPGQIDDIRFFNRVLSAAEVAAIYNATR